jgi:hypothetical protein
MSYFLQSNFRPEYLNAYFKALSKDLRYLIKYLPILVCSSLIIGGCQTSESKSSKCNKLIQVTNTAKSLYVPKNSAEFIKLAKGLEKLNLKVEAIAIEDPKLNEYKAQFSQLYLGIAQASRQVSQANLTRDRNLLNLAQINLKTSITKEQSLVVAVNQYCNQE